MKIMKWFKAVSLCWMACLVAQPAQPAQVLTEADSVDPGTVVITVNNHANLGYLGFAQTLSRIVRNALPERKIQIVAEVSDAEMVELFRFPNDDRTELLVLKEGSQNSETGREKVMLANRWLSEAGHVLRVSHTFYLDYPPHLRSRTSLFRQICNILDSLPYEQFVEYFQEYQTIAQNAGIGISKKMWRQYWRQHFSGIASEEPGENRTVEYLFAKYKRPDISHDFSYSASLGVFAMGLGDGQLMPVLPELYNRESQQVESSFRQSYQNLKDHYPQLREVLDSATNGFYMSYIHNPIKLAEFITMAALIDGVKDTLVLASGGGHCLEDEISQYLLSEHHVELIDLTNQMKPRTRVFNQKTPGDYQKMVQVVVLPKINEPSEYLSLFYYSHPVVGTTGNTTLFNALAMGKLPFYSPNLSVQFFVNKQLALQDASSSLAPFFSNLLRPEEKAEIVRRYSTLIPGWAARIVQKKSLNQHLIDAIR